MQFKLQINISNFFFPPPSQIKKNFFSQIIEHKSNLLKPIFQLRNARSDFHSMVTYIFKQLEHSDHYKGKEDDKQNRDSGYKNTYVNVQIPLKKH